MPETTKYRVRFSILTISGRKREIHEKDVTMIGVHSPYLVKRVKEHMKRNWYHSKIRILSIKKA